MRPILTRAGIFESITHEFENRNTESNTKN